MTVRDLLASIVRTLVPVVAGLLISAAAKAGVDLSGTAEPFVDAVFIGGYYSLVRFLEAKYSWAGVLLGWKSQPQYDGAERA